MRTQHILLTILFVRLLWPQEDSNAQSTAKQLPSKTASKKGVKLPPGPSLSKVTGSTKPGIDSLREVYNSKTKIAQLEKELAEVKKRLQDSMYAAAQFRKKVVAGTRALNKRVAEIKIRAAADEVERAMDDSLQESLDKTMFKIGTDTLYLPRPYYVPVLQKRKGIWPFRRTYYDTLKTAP